MGDVCGYLIVLVFIYLFISLTMITYVHFYIVKNLGFHAGVYIISALYGFLMF